MYKIVLYNKVNKQKQAPSAKEIMTMKIYTEKSLKDFDFWSGAEDTAVRLDDEDFEIIEQHLEDLYPDGMTETEINDLFWFEEDMLAEWLGYSDFEALIEDREGE